MYSPRKYSKKRFHLHKPVMVMTQGLTHNGIHTAGI